MENKHVTIYEVGPRDGLQNEKAIISTADKIALIDCLSMSGLTKIEVTSFVSPKWVPQMADANQVMQAIKRNSKIDYAVLTPNLRGLDAALKAKADEVAIFASASEGFSQKNINCSIDESIERFKPVAKAALEAGVKLRGYVSCIVECPYDGAVAPQAVIDVTNKLFDLGCYEVSLGDTIGKAMPQSITRLFDKMIPNIHASKLAGHFHDTAGNAIDNIDIALRYGLRTFDSAIGGLGGCPYAPGAKGNVSTIPLVEHLHGIGWQTELNLNALNQAQSILQSWNLSKN